MQFGGLNLAKGAASTPEAVLCDSVDFLDGVLAGRLAPSKVTTVAFASSIQGGVAFGVNTSLVVAGGKLYSLNTSTGAITSLNGGSVFCNTTNPVTFETTGLNGKAIICDNAGGPWVWDGSTLRVMGPPTKPSSAPTVSQQTPATGIIYNNTNSGTATTGRSKISMQWQQGAAFNSILQTVVINAGMPSTGAQDTATLSIYSSPSSFGSNPKGGQLLGTVQATIYPGTLSGPNFTSLSTFSFTTPGITLTGGTWYSLVLETNDGQNLQWGLGIAPPASNVVTNVTEYSYDTSWHNDVSGLAYTGFKLTKADPSFVAAATYQYAYSYVNSTRNIESDMSPPISATFPPGLQALVGVTASGDSNVTGVRIYRIGGTLAQYMLVPYSTTQTDWPNATANLTDYWNDSQLLVSATNVGNRAFGSDGTNPLGLARAKYLPYSGILLGYTANGGANDGVIFASKQDGGNPSNIEIWKGNQYQAGSVSNPVRGIVINANNATAILQKGAVPINGTDPSYLYMEPSKGAPGTTAPLSVADSINGGIYLGSDAVYETQSSFFSAFISQYKPVKLAEIRSLIKSSFLAGNPVGLFFNRQYFLAGNSGLLVYDFRREMDVLQVAAPSGGNPITAMWTDGTTMWYAGADFNVYAWEGGANPMNWTWESVVLDEGKPNTWQGWNQVTVDCVGTLAMYVYIDGVLILTVADVTGGDSTTRMRRRFDISGTTGTTADGYRAQVKFVATGSTAQVYGFGVSVIEAAGGSGT